MQRVPDNLGRSRELVSAVEFHVAVYPFLSRELDGWRAVAHLQKTWRGSRAQAVYLASVPRRWPPPIIRVPSPRCKRTSVRYHRGKDTPGGSGCPVDAPTDGGPARTGIGMFWLARLLLVEEGVYELVGVERSEIANLLAGADVLDGQT